MPTIHQTTDLKTKLPDIVSIARLAPSVHNTQPWKVSAEDSSIRVSLDAAHTLSDGDPTGRQTIISLGIFTEALIIAAASYGFTEEKVTFDGSSVTIALGESQAASSVEKIVSLLRKRSSDRSLYQPVTIDKEAVQTIEQAGEQFRVSVQVVQDQHIIDQIAHLTCKGIGLALSNPSFRKELSGYLVLPWSGKKRGIAVKSLYINPVVAVLEPLFMRLGIGISKEVSLEEKRWLSASGVVVIIASGDLAQFWLAAGRAYLRISLAIEDLGLAQATSAAIVEASNYHEDVEQLLHTNQRILSVIRIGRGSPKRYYSPRVNVHDLLT